MKLLKLVPDHTNVDFMKWRNVALILSLIAGLRADFWNVTSEATPGYDIASVIAGAEPPIDPSTLPNPNRDSKYSPSKHAGAPSGSS